MPVPSVARPSMPSISADTAQAPSPSENASSSMVARRKPAAGRQQRDRLDQIGLAGAVGAVSTTGPGRRELDLRGVIAAEIGQASGGG